MTEKIEVIMMLEILGKPPKYVKEVLKKIVEEIGKFKDTKIITKKIAEPRQVEQDGKKQDAYTSFAEIQLETTLQQLSFIIFNYTPSHIDIIKPDTLQISNYEMNSFYNELIRKLHQYDEVARTLLMEKDNILKQIEEAKIKLQPEEVHVDKKNKKKKTKF